MIRNYLKTAFRSLLRNKLYTGLNIAGLTFGLSCFLLIGIFVFDELTFDRQHTKQDRIYRVIEQKSVNGRSTVIAGAGYQLAEESKKKIMGVENTTRIQRIGRANILNTENPSVFFQETVTIADEHLLEIFDFPLIAGDKTAALKEPNSIIITRDLALRLFGNADALGKTLQFSFIESPLKITGILENHPRNSSFDFSSAISEITFRNNPAFKERMANDWLSDNFSVYALLRPHVKVDLITQQLFKLVHDNSTVPAGTTYSFSLQPLKDIHLHSENIIDGARNSNVDATPQGSALNIKIFAFFAFFVLLIAGINYMNLTTARASSRVKEIGVRKTIGALQNNLIKQFLLESLLVTFISFLCALAVVNLVLPTFNAFTNKELSLNFKTDYHIWLYAVVFAGVTGLLSGAYPAFLLSRFKPVMLLKGHKLQNKSGLSLKKGLVVFQFSVSIVMIVATTVLFLQVRYLNNTDLGFNKNLLVVIDINTSNARKNFEGVKAEMLKIPAVQAVSVTSRVPGEWKTIHTVKVRTVESTNEPINSYLFGADKDFFKTFETKLLSGRNFETKGDSASIIVNETAAKLLGIKEASGQLVEIPEVSENGDGDFNLLNNDGIPFKPRVIGIVKDFNFQTLHQRIQPLILGYTNNPVQKVDYYTAKIAAANIKSTLNKLKGVMLWNDKTDPFEYHFLNDQLALFYLEDGRRQTILIWVAAATIFIACLGLFGLATYSAEQRIKEIGIRKVMGATVVNLASLLSKDFIKLVLIANGIAFPVAWFAVSKWMQQYAYHINVQWWIFVLAGGIALLVAALTISFQAIKAALANPVESLRSE